VVIPVHLAGQPCDMAAIAHCHRNMAFGSLKTPVTPLVGDIKMKPIGNCRYSDITGSVFILLKTITTLKGGMAVTNDPELTNRMARLRISRYYP